MNSGFSMGEEVLVTDDHISHDVAVQMLYNIAEESHHQDNRNKGGLLLTLF